MNKIKTLKQEVYNKIAAGEVVERPLSVVKELVENSIDSGADEINVDVLEGGKKLIRVSDNGEGFEPDEIELAFKRHSTSKLSEITDLDSLKTLGFRGEALFSILEVSKVEVKTSNNNQGKGIQCFFEDSQLSQRQEIAFKRGTTIEVRDLFYNFPVRKKFLKSERSELTQIVSFLEQIALAFFNISFKLTSNNKDVFIYNRTGELKERIYQVFGKNFIDSVKEINFELMNHKLSGFISKLNTGVALKRHQFFFVNKRPVREKTLISSFNNAFRNFLEKQKNPVGILMLEVPQNDIDVNIHPMKIEIRFRDSSFIYQFIKRAVESSFSSTEDLITDRDFKSQDRAAFSEPGYRSNIQDFRHDQSELFEEGFFREDDFFLIGQYKNSFIIVEKDEELLIIDQHNAQERINFEKLKKEYMEENVVSISPLFPVIIELSTSELSALDKGKRELLERMGFEMEFLSGNSVDIKKFPQILEERNIKDVVLSVIYLKDDRLNFEDRVLAEVACKSSIKINQRLSPVQMRATVRDLFGTSNPYFCPHNRPVIIKFSLEEIEKMLKRK